MFVKVVSESECVKMYSMWQFGVLSDIYSMTYCKSQLYHVSMYISKYIHMYISKYIHIL